MSDREELTNFNNFVAVRCCTVKRSISARRYTFLCPFQRKLGVIVFFKLVLSLSPPSSPDELLEVLLRCFNLLKSK